MKERFKDERAGKAIYEEDRARRVTPCLYEQPSQNGWRPLNAHSRSHSLPNR